MSEDVILGIDVGTTATKVAAFTARGEVVASYFVGYEMSRPRPGWAEQDPEDWWNACAAGISRVMSIVDGVRSVGVVSQVNTHVFVDSELRPLGPAVTWQDQRCADVARVLDSRFSAAEKTGIWGAEVTLDASFLPARALWFAEHEPSLWARTRWVLSPKDFITAKLTGQVATDQLTSVRLVDAAGYLDEAVGLVDGLAERLPPLAEPDFVLGQTEGAEVVVGTMDAFGTVYGAGTTSPGRGMVSCGTSVVVAGASELSVPVAGIVTFPPSRGVFVHAGPTQAGGDALRWWSRVSGLPIEDVLAEAAKSSPGANGLVFTPHLMGERAPLWDSDVRGSFFGLSSDTTGSDLARAVLEGVAMSARQIVGPVEEACGGPLESITLSGGGARSDLWAQVFADVLRRPVERLAVLDSAVLGAALLGSVGAGLHPDIETAAREAVAVERVFVPGVDVYEPLYRAYTVSYGALAGVHAELSGWRGNVRAVLEV